MKNFAKVALGLAIVTVAIPAREAASTSTFGNTENGRMKRDSLTPTLNNLNSLL